MKKLLVITAASALVSGFALNASADANFVGDRSDSNVSVTLSNNQIAYARDNAMAIVAQGNVVTQIISSSYTYNGADECINAANPATAGSALAGTGSGEDGASFSGAGGCNSLGTGLDGSGSLGASGGYAQAIAPVSAGVVQNLGQSLISNGVGNSVNSINILATNSVSQVGIGGSFSSVSNTTINEGKSGSGSDSARE